MSSILFVSTMNGAPWGGSEELWSRTAVRMAADGHRVACAAFGWHEKRDRLESLRRAGCEVHVLPNWGRRKRTPLEKALHEGLTKPAQAVAVARLPWDEFDLAVISQGGWSDVTARPFRRVDRRAGAFVLLYHAYSEDRPPSRLADLGRLAREARANLFAARRIEEVLSDRLGARVPNAALFQNPLTFEVPEELPPFPDAAEARFVVLSSIEFATKAQDLLLEVLSGEVWRARGWKLDVYGGGPDRARLDALVRERRLAGRVVVHGHTSRVAEALAGAHLLLQPSRVDAAPISVREAMAVGRACVVTRVGDMARWIRHGRTGFVSEGPDAASVARALEEAWENRDRWEQMGRAARVDFLAQCPRDPIGELAAALARHAERA